MVYLNDGEDDEIQIERFKRLIYYSLFQPILHDGSELERQ